MSGSRATEEELRALVAQDSSTLPALEAAMYEPESASNKLNVYEKAAWGRQNEVLRAYSLCRTKSVAARVTGVGRTTIHEWVKADYLGFKDRLAAADEAFLGDLENLALNRVRAQKPGDNPTLLIMLLNGNLPDKYRPNSGILGRPRFLQGTGQRSCSSNGARPPNIAIQADRPSASRCSPIPATQPPVVSASWTPRSPPGGRCGFTATATDW